MRTFALFLLMISCAGAQPTFSDRLTFSGGWTQQFGGYSYVSKESATSGSLLRASFLGTRHITQVLHF